MTRLHPDDIRAIAQEIATLLGLVPPANTPPLTIAQQAIAMAKQGKHEESKALLKSYSKQRGA